MRVNIQEVMQLVTTLDLRHNLPPNPPANLTPNPEYPRPQDKDLNRALDLVNLEVLKSIDLSTTGTGKGKNWITNDGIRTL